MVAFPGQLGHSPRSFTSFATVFTQAIRSRRPSGVIGLSCEMKGMLGSDMSTLNRKQACSVRLSGYSSPSSKPMSNTTNVSSFTENGMPPPQEPPPQVCNEKDSYGDSPCISPSSKFFSTSMMWRQVASSAGTPGAKSLKDEIISITPSGMECIFNACEPNIYYQINEASCYAQTI